MGTSKPLVGRDLLVAWNNWRRSTGRKKSEIIRECGYVSIKRDGSERLNYTAFYEALIQAQGAANLSDLKAGHVNNSPINERHDHTIMKLRKAAQRKLLDGKMLTETELASLPDYQRNALQRRGMQTITRRPERLTGQALLSKARNLYDEGVDELSIARKCGYIPEELGSFRRELSRSLKTPIAPLSRLLNRGTSKSSAASPDQLSAENQPDREQLRPAMAPTTDAEGRAVNSERMSVSRLPIPTRRLNTSIGIDGRPKKKKLKKAKKKRHKLPVSRRIQILQGGAPQ